MSTIDFICTIGNISPGMWYFLSFQLEIFEVGDKQVILFPDGCDNSSILRNDHF